MQALKETLTLPPGLDGDAWLLAGRGGLPRPRRHDELEANLVISGRATYLLTGHRCDLQRGSLLWLFPDQDHILTNTSPDLSMWVVVWRPALIRRSCTSTSPVGQILQTGDPGLKFKQLGGTAARRVAQLFDETANVRADADLCNAALAYALLASWRAFEEADDVEARVLHPAVRSAVRLLRADPVALTLNELAEEVGLSPGRLSRVFKAETGSSLVRFRQALQLERFQSLYDRGRMKLLPAALEAGFGSYAQFYRVHKQLTGRRPGAAEVGDPA